MPNLIKIATKGAGIGFQVGSFVAGQAFNRVQSLLGKDDDDSARYAPAPVSQTPAKAAPAPAKLESVPTTAKTTATGPGGTRTAPPAPKKQTTAKPSTGGTKGETTTTVKAAPRTGPRSAGGRISNPKAARKARARAATATSTAQPGTPTGGAADLSKAKGKGGRPATVKAENSPAELAAAKQGKQAAPMGGSDS